MTNKDVPRGDAAPRVYNKVLELLGDTHGKKVLDAPCGEGPFSLVLKVNGFDVWATDLNEEKFKAEGVRFDKSDMNADLPYDDGFFDAVVCIEGIEHLENAHHLVREFRRVLKPGGILVITTPNTLSVHSRLRYLLFGSPDRHHSEIDHFHGSLYEELRRHINPLGYTSVRYVLRNNGFNIEGISTNRSILSYRGGNPLLRIMMPVIFLFTGAIIKIIAGNFRKTDSLEGVLISDDILYGEHLIVKARKQEAG